MRDATGFAAVVIMMCLLSSPGAGAPLGSAVESVFGTRPKPAPDGVKVRFPRTDLTVRIGEVNVDPGLALTSWAAFWKRDHFTELRGDLVLRAGEVAPVTETLTQNGIDVTALHNHLVGESPSVMFLHFRGRGKAKSLGETLKRALETTDTPLDVTASPDTGGPAPEVLEQVLGEGKRVGGLVKFGFHRREPIAVDGAVMPGFTGVTMGVGFQPLGGDRFATTGDLILRGHEVNPVVNALVSHGIRVTALHNHMLEESPRLFYLHFWGQGASERLAQGIRAALEQTSIERSFP